MQKRSIFRVFQGFIRTFFAGDQYFQALLLLKAKQKSSIFAIEKTKFDF